MYYVNENIKNAERVFPDQGRSGFLRLDMNENPIGLPESVVNEIRAAITPEFLSRYPEPDSFIRKYADFIGFEPENVCVMNGSDNAIRAVLQTFVRISKDVLTVSPTFEMYMVNCWLFGFNHKTVPYDDLYHIDVSKIVAAIDDDTDVVALVNPNNPIGNTYETNEVERIAEVAAMHGAIVVIDEAYHYFTDKTCIDLVRKYDNVIVLRTFSKCFSLAGVRLGVAISNPTVIGYLNNLRLSFEVNTVALKCGEIVLGTPGLIQSLATIQKEGRDYAKESLIAHGYEVIPSEANFICFKPKTSSQSVLARLKDEKILVKSFGSGLLGGWLRINSGSMECMSRFLDILYSVDK